MNRDLSGRDYVYVWVDGIHTGVRLGGDDRLCCLVMVGARLDGKKELVAIRDVFPETRHQRDWVHFERNVLSHVPASSMDEVAEDLKAIFKVRQEKTARALAEDFIELYGGCFPKAVSVFEAGADDALAYLDYPGSHHARIRTTNVLERLFEEVNLRTRVVVRMLPNEVSASTQQQAVGAEALPHDGRPRSNRETKPATFETLTCARQVVTNLASETLTSFPNMAQAGVPFCPPRRYIESVSSAFVRRIGETSLWYQRLSARPLL